MQLILALACEQATVRDDGNLDVVGVFHSLSAPGFPAEHAFTVVFVMEWTTSEAGSQPLRADMIDDQDRMLLTIQGHTEVDTRPPDQPPPQTRVVLPLERVIFPAAGRYRFRLRAGAGEVVTLPIFLAEQR